MQAPVPVVEGAPKSRVAIERDSEGVCGGRGKDGVWWMLKDEHGLFCIIRRTLIIDDLCQNDLTSALVNGIPDLLF